MVYIENTNFFLMFEKCQRCACYQKSWKIQHLKPLLPQQHGSFQIHFNTFPKIWLWESFDVYMNNFNHRPVISKLSKYGRSRVSLHLFFDYISNHKQYVSLNSFRSLDYTALSEILQFSVFSLLLFNIFVDDISETMNNYYYCW